MITMILHKEVTRSELSGLVASSIDYLKQKNIKRSTNSDIKTGFKSMSETCKYYLDKQVDTEFFIHAVRHHNKNERELKCRQSFDKKLGRVGTGRMIVINGLMQLLDKSTN
jgi:hypothetical protein